MTSSNVYLLIYFIYGSWTIIDSPHYQRLRDLHQLGANYFVFPSANHSRFEHSLGTGHLCKDFLNRIKTNQPGVEITDVMERSLIVAGLCHNLGHGPYSYPFTDFVQGVLQDKTWDSTTATLNIVENMIDTNSIDLTREEINLVKDILIGENKFTRNYFEENIFNQEQNKKCLDGDLICENEINAEIENKLENEIENSHSQYENENESRHRNNKNNLNNNQNFKSTNNEKTKNSEIKNNHTSSQIGINSHNSEIINRNLKYYLTSSQYENNHDLNSTIFNSSFPTWILQILNNKLNGVDIDKFDFIRRDSYKLGCPKESFNGEILLNHARVIQNNICFREKDAYSIYELFNSRYRLFKEYYLHRVAKGIDLMIKDVFTEANSFYNFQDYLYDPLKFLTLKDSILTEIMWSEKESLKKAKLIVQRINKRNLYKFVGEKTCVMSANKIDDYDKFLNMSEEDIINCSSSESSLEVGDIKILKCQLDFCKGDEDPVEYVKFYNYDVSQGQFTVKNLDRNDISLLTPRCFREFILRVYVTDAEKLDAAKKAFSKFCSERTGESPDHHGKKSANKYEKIC